MELICSKRVALFKAFIVGSQKVVEAEDICCKPGSKSSVSLYKKGKKIASRSPRQSHNTICIRRDFIHLPEIDPLLAQAGYFVIEGSDGHIIKYKNFVPAGYRYNYSLPQDLWIAWASNTQSSQKSPIVNWNGYWEKVLGISFNRHNYAIQLKEIVSVPSENLLLWADPTVVVVLPLSLVDNLESLSQDLSQCIISEPEISSDKMWFIIKALEFKIAERDLQLKADSAEVKERLKERQLEQKEHGKAMSKSLAIAKKEISKISNNGFSGSDLLSARERIQEAIDICKKIFGDY